MNKNLYKKRYKIIKKHKVLIIVESFPTSGGRRIDNFIKYLPENGWIPIVLATKGQSFNDEEKILKKYSDEVKVFKSYSLLKSPFRIFSRLFGLYGTTAFFEKLIFIPDISITWSLHGILKGLKIIKEENVDLIMTSSPPESAHIIGLVLAKKTGRKFIADFRDLWTDYVARYKPPTIFHNLLTKWLEKIIFQGANYIIANTYENKKIYMNNHNVPDKKVTVITNGYDPDDLKKINALNIGRERETFCIGYMGNFDKPFFPWKEFLIGFKKFVTTIKKINVKLNIYGYVSKTARRYVHSDNIKNYVVFHGEFPHFHAVKLASENHLLLLLLQEDDSSHAIVPLKLYTYLIMNRPILAIAPNNGEVCRILHDSNVGEIISVIEINKLLEKLRSYYRRWSLNGKLEYHPNYKIIEQFNSKLLTAKLASVFDNNLNKNNRNAYFL